MADDGMSGAGTPARDDPTPGGTAASDLTGAGTPAGIVDGYLAEVAARLPGPRRTRNAVLTEIRDGLHEAVDGYTAAGMDTVTATRAAVTRFGTPDAVAGAFLPELATAHARRTIAAFVLSGPLVGIWWLLLLDPRPWSTGPLALIAAIPALPVIALAIAAAAGTFATTGRLIRWLPEASPERALAATTAIAVLCLAGDLSVLGVLGTRLATGQATATLLAGAAATASLVRVAAARRAIVHSSRTRWWPPGVTGYPAATGTGTGRSAR